MGSVSYWKKRFIRNPERRFFQKAGGSMVRQWAFLIACFAGLLIMGQWPILWDWTRRMTLSTVDFVGNNQERENSNIPKASLSHYNEPWSHITPSRALVYQPCFGSFNCTRLDLPMDWNRSDADGPRLQLAIAKLPAKVPVTDERYGGLLWLQSGGPGESGIDFLITYGKSIQMIVDSHLNPSDEQYNTTSIPKYFDILGIDSRGLNNSTPCFSCFPTLESRQTWTLQSAAEGLIGSSDSSFANMWSRFQALGKGCSSKAANSDKYQDQLALHVGTTPQIADMTAILELHGQWREQNARQYVDKEKARLSEDESSRIIERTRWRENEEKLNYWGFSYGTCIGATFAAMQPHRAERVVLDGVVDTVDYYRGERLHNLQDTDNVVDRFAEHCDAAGPQLCPFHTDGGAESIVQRFHHILESLKENPVGVAARGEKLAPHLITYSDMVRATFSSLYAPIQEFPTLAARLADLSHGNGTSMVGSNQRQQRYSLLDSENHDNVDDDPEISRDSPNCDVQRHSPGDTRMAILCSDGDSTFNMTRHAFADYVITLQQQSPTFGGMYAQFRMMCAAWGVRPRWRFPGPYGARTAYPMLIVGTEVDPVTPIANAHAVSARFPDSVVLPVAGEGHSTLSSPSLCEALHIRRYFQDGRLPAVGTVCGVNEKPFLGVTEPAGGGEGEERLLEELRWVARHWS